MNRIPQLFALLIGVSFVLAGIGGFAPGISTAPLDDAPDLVIDANYGYLLGLFPVNIVHNLIHLGFGVWGLFASRAYGRSRLYARGMFPLLGVFAILGIIPAWSSTAGLLPLFGHDIWLHGLEALLAGYIGFLLPDTRRATSDTLIQLEQQ